MADWEWKKIHEIIKIINGYSFNSKDFSSKNMIKSVKITNVGVKEFIEETENYLPEKYKETLKEFQVKEGNIVIALTRTIIAAGLKVAIVPKSYDGALLNQRVAALIPNDETINQQYLYHFLCTDTVTKYVTTNVKTLMQPNLSINDLKNLIVPCPSLCEQKRIVAILDESFENITKAKENAEKNLKNAKDIHESYLQNIFENKGEGWDEKKLIDICNLINGRAYNKKELLKNGKYTVLRVGNFFTNKQWYYSDLELPEDKYCDKGDLLYAWSASFGPRIWDGDKVIYHYHIWKVIPNLNLVSKEFLFILLEWDKEKIKAAQGTGTTMMHVSKGSMEERIIPLPNLREQQIIVSMLNALSAETKKLEAIYTQKLADLEELKKSILAKAFKGELTEVSI